MKQLVVTWYHPRTGVRSVNRVLLPVHPDLRLLDRSSVVSVESPFELYGGGRSGGSGSDNVATGQKEVVAAVDETLADQKPERKSE